MERQPVKSTVLASIGYDPQAEVLEIEFCSGRIYRYHGVSAELHAWLMRSPHKGGIFNRMIDGKFEFDRIDHIDPNAPSLMDVLRASLQHASEKGEEPES